MRHSALVRWWLVLLAVMISCSIAPAQTPAKPEEPPKPVDPAPKVKLQFAPLEVPGAVLTKSAFVYKKRSPALFYWGMVLPKSRMDLSKQTSARTLTLAGVKCTIELDKRRRFHLKTGRKDLVLKQTRHGLAGVPIALGKGRQYQLGFPRAFTYLQKGAIYYRSGCVQTGTLAGQGIALYDENLDGNYGRKGDFIRIGPPGNANVFAPIADFVPTPSAVYKINNIAKDGSLISLTRHTGDTGRVVLGCRAKGIEGHFAIASADGKTSFGAVAQNQTLTVIPGKYRLLYGFLFDGKSRKVLALALPGKMAPVVVAKIKPEPKADPKADPKAKPKPKPKPKAKAKPQATAMTFAEAAHLEFAFKKKAGKVVIVGPIIVRGKLGEEYVGMDLAVRACLTEVLDPKAKKRRPKQIEIGRFKVPADPKDEGRAEYPFDLPKVDEKPVKGNWSLDLYAPVPGLGTVKGAKPISL